MRVIEVDENTRLPLRIVSISGAVLVSITAWLVTLSINSNANTIRLDKTDAERAYRHEKYEGDHQEEMTELAAIRQEVKDLRNEIEHLHRD